MAMTPTQWADALRGSIAQCVAAMREIQTMSQASEWDAYFSAWLADTTIPKDSRKTIKHLLPAIISIAEDMDDVVLSDLGINAAGLPLPATFAGNNDVEPQALRIVQIDVVELADETAHAVLMVTKAGRSVELSVHDTDGVAIGSPMLAAEVLPSVFRVLINWKSLNVAPNYYIIKASDHYELDAKIVEINSATSGLFAKATISFS